jgi:WD40 repeat protein
MSREGFSGNPRIFLSYARKDGEKLATQLRTRLETEEPEITLWQDRAQMEGGVGWWKQIEEALDQVKFLVIVMTPVAMQSETTREEWRYARQRGVNVYPVKGCADAELDYASLPKWMRKAHFFDLDKEWKTFVNYLKSDRQPSRVPFMAPDLSEGFVKRQREFEELLSLLLDQSGENPVAVTTTLHGAGGNGKTMLAAALCYDNRVIDAFDDGILWVTLGRGASENTILRELTRLYEALTGEQPPFVDATQASMKLAEKFDHRNCLVIIDDVWTEANLGPFLRGGKGCARLITTRQFEVARGRRSLKVNEMTANESVQMLIQRLPTPPAQLTSFRQLARRLGEWPLLLKLAAGGLRARLDYGDSLEGALNSVNRALDKGSVFAFDREDSDQRSVAVKNTVELSTDLLDQSDLERLINLAIFPENTEIPLTTLQRLWKFNDLGDTESCAQRLADHSLVDLNLRHGTIGLHDVMRSYLSKKLPSPAAVHNKLVNAWGDLLRLPDAYAWRWVMWHLKQAGRSVELRQLLFDFNWLQGKLEATNSNALIDDFDLLGEDEDGRVVQSAIRLSAHVLGRNSRELPAQLTGRLIGNRTHNIQALLKQGASKLTYPWLRPLTPSLTPPGGPLIRTFEGHTDSVRAVAITSDGRCAVSGSDDRRLRVWNLESGQALRTLKGHASELRAVAVTPDGRGAISASNRTLRLWDLENGQSGHTLRGHTDWIRAVVVTPDGRCAVSASDDGTLRVWDLKSGQTLGTLEGHSGEVFAVAVTPEGQRVVSGSSNGTLRVWDLKSGLTLRTLEGHTGSVWAVAVTHDGRRAVSASRDRTLRLWELESGQTLRTLTGHMDSVSAVALTPDDRLVVSASWDRTLRLWDLESGQSVCTFRGHTDFVRTVAITPDGRRSISGSDDRTLRVWELENRPRCTLQDHADWVWAVAITADGRRLVSASRDRTLRVWDMENSQALLTLEGNSDSISAVTVTPDGCHIVSASDDGTLRLWDLESGVVLRKLEGHTKSVSAIAVVPDGRRAISGSDDRTLQIWDLESGQALRTLKGHMGSVWAIAVMPDGRRAISGSDDRTLRVWDLESGQALHKLEGHTDSVSAVAVTPDGRRAISASSDGTLRVWDLETAQTMRILDGHTNSVWAVAVTPDGCRAVSGSDDGTLRVWDLESGEEITSFTGEGRVLSCAFAPDGKTIIAGDESGHVHFLRLEGVD